jgi:hypothetical protein
MRRVGWLIAAAMIAGGAWALDPPRPAPAPPATAEQPAPTASAAAAPTTAPAAEQPTEPAAEEETLPPLPPDARRTGPTPQRFDPTEEVRADFPVSFPSDI